MTPDDEDIAVAAEVERLNVMTDSWWCYALERYESPAYCSWVSMSGNRNKLGHEKCGSKRDPLGRYIPYYYPQGPP